MTEMFEKKPSDFQATLHVAGVYLAIDNTLLFLERTKLEKGLWGIPGGKLDDLEDPKKGVIRELYEETLIQIDEPIEIGELYFRKPHIDYVFHVFHLKLDHKPIVQLNEEHSNYGWYTLDEAKNLPLMAGGVEALNYLARNIGLSG